ncbi:MAG: hypothetical protein AB7S38_08375 [Vulcanimicrobiota bacterium]
MLVKGTSQSTGPSRAKARAASKATSKASGNGQASAQAKSKAAPAAKGRREAGETSSKAAPVRRELTPQTEELREDSRNPTPAQEIYDDWAADPAQLADDLRDSETLDGLSDDEYLALAQLAEEDEEVGQAAQSALDQTVESFEEFEQIPTALGFQRLLYNNQNEDTQQRVGTLLSQHLETRLEDLLDGAEGDEEADQALATFGEQLPELLERHPALAPHLEQSANSALGELDEAITSIRRADDSAWQRVGNAFSDLGHTITDLVNPATGGIALASLVNDAVTGLSGATLDLVGADGLADQVRQTGDQADEFFDDLSEDVSNGVRRAFGWVGEQFDHNLVTSVFTAPIEAFEEVVEGGARLLGADGLADNLDRVTNQALDGLDLAVSTGVEAVTGLVGQAVRDISQGVADQFSLPLELLDTAVGAGAQGLSGLAGRALDAVGAEGLAAQVRTAGDQIDLASDQASALVTHQVDNFFGGFGEAAAGTVEGLGTIVTQPGQVITGLGYVATQPELLLESFRPILEEHGVAGIAGAVAFEVLTEVATGGGLAGAHGAGLVDEVAEAATFADEVAEAATVADEIVEAGRVDGVIDLSHLDEYGNPIFTGNPFDDQARFQIFSQGYSTDPAYLETIQEATRALAENPPATLREALDQLAEGPLGAFGREHFDDSFLVERADDPTILTRTPITGRYGDAGGAVTIRDRVGAASSLQIGDELLELTPVLRNSEGVPFAWVHTSPATGRRLLDLADDFYRRALDPNLPLDETVDAVARVNWLLAQATPYHRGSASAQNAVVRSLFDARGIEAPIFRPGISPDLEAFVTDFDTFAQNFPDFFVERPRLPAQAAEIASPSVLGFRALAGSIFAQFAASDEAA